MGNATKHIVVDDTGYTPAAESVMYIVEESDWERAKQLNQMIPGPKKDKKIQAFLAEIREKAEYTTWFPMGAVAIIFD